MHLVLTLFFAVSLSALADKTYHRPAIIKASELNEFSKLSKPRKKLIKKALKVARDNRQFTYHFGGAESKKDGFDCSGAMYFVLRSSGFNPPRTSAQQFAWVEDLTKISPKVRELNHPSFKDLTPGDLVFWSGTYRPSDGRKSKITHVAMYLGTEKKDNRAVMICATKGRSYRGKRGDGFGVYDFKIPSMKSRSKLVGYGSPPGL